MNYSPTPKKTPPAALKRFQKEYATFLRDPNNNSKPKGVPARQSKVYEELLFNNVCGFIDNCFPVAKSILSCNTAPSLPTNNDQKTTAWLQLCRHFFKSWKSQTPYFGKIPEEFVSYLNSKTVLNSIPPWLPELAHYEWIELLVETHPACIKKTENSQNILRVEDVTLRTNPTLQILNYEWNVQCISKSHIPTKKETTHLLVYRTSNHSVEFMATNTITAAMLEIIEQNPDNLDVTMKTLGHLTNNNNTDQLKQFANPIIQDLLARQVLLIHDD